MKIWVITNLRPKFCRILNKVITLNINEKDNYNEYRFGNIKISKQPEFIYYFWLALSLCHEVISISKNKQNQKIKNDDAMFIFHDNEQTGARPPRIVKKMTYDQRIDRRMTVRNDTARDDFDVGNSGKLLDNGEISDNEMNEELSEDRGENGKDDEAELDSLSELDIDENDELVYHGMSPDEITLVEAAKEVGFEFRYRSNKEVEIKLEGVSKKYRLLKIFPFTSDRKRMTIVVQDPEDPEYAVAFTKGADNVMKALSLAQYSNHFEFSYINQFAKKGYRTLLVGMKVIRYDEFKEWEEAYDEINREMDNNNEEELEQLVYLIEKDIFLLGTTALEDRLQDNVHE